MAKRVDRIRNRFLLEVSHEKHPWPFLNLHEQELEMWVSAKVSHDGNLENERVLFFGDKLLQ